MTDILIIEDEKELAALLCDFLRAEHYTVTTAGSGEQALRLYETHAPKLVVLDICLPGMDGFSVLQKLRERGNTPVLIVSARTAKEDQLNGLLSGADDYIEKPYDIDIMLAKIGGILRRRCARELTDGGLRISQAARTVTRDGTPLDLTAKEFDLLWLLMENRGRALSKEFLFRQVWGSDSFSEPQTLTVHIQWLRQKIEDDPKHPQKIVTVWSVGYKYQ